MLERSWAPRKWRSPDVLLQANLGHALDAWNPFESNWCHCDQTMSRTWSQPRASYTLSEDDMDCLVDSIVDLRLLSAIENPFSTAGITSREEARWNHVCHRGSTQRGHNSCARLCGGLMTQRRGGPSASPASVPASRLGFSGRTSRWTFCTGVLQGSYGSHLSTGSLLRAGAKP